MRIVKYSIILLLVSTLSCEKVLLIPKEIDFEKFSLTVPNNWDPFQVQGIDSYVGGITNGRDSLTFDYGWYSYGLSNETEETHSRVKTTIDGYDALIVIPYQPRQEITGMYIELDSMNRFNLYGMCRNEATAMKIFSSVEFQ